MAETLSYSMTVNIADLERRTREASRIVANADTSIKSQFRSTNAAVTQGLSQSGQAMSRFGQITNSQRAIIQNTSYQFADLAVQIGGGTSVFRALGQQLPQLLGPLGTFGALAGVAAAVLLPLIGAMGGSEDAAETLKGAIGAVEKALSGYKSAIDLANMSTVDMEAKFGSAAVGIRAIAAEIAAIRADQAQRAIDGLAGSLSDMMGVGGDGDRRQGVAGFFDLNIMLAFTDAQRVAREEARELTGEFLRHQDAIAAANGDIDAQITATQSLLSVITAMASAKDGISGAEDEIITKVVETLDVMVKQKALIEEATGAAKEMTVPMSATVDHANGILAALDLMPASLLAATESTNGLAAAAAIAAGNFLIAAQNAEALRRQGAIDIAAMNSSSAYAPGKAEGVGDPNVIFNPPTANAPTSSPRPQPAPNDIDLDLPPVDKKAASAANKAANEMAREAERVFESVRTKAEEYAAEVANLKTLLDAGAISQETYNRAVAELDKEFAKLDGTAAQAADAIKSAFDGIFDDPARALEDLAKQLLQMVLYAQLAKSLPGVFGGGGIIPLVPNAKGGVYSGAGIGGHSGSVVSSPTVFAFAKGAGLMGEAGPEAILPLARGGDGKLGVVSQGGAGGGATVNVHNYGNPDSVKTQTRKGPNGEEMIDIHINQAMSRGRYDGGMKRFGAQPQTVRR